MRVYTHENREHQLALKYQLPQMKEEYTICAHTLRVQSHTQQYTVFKVQHEFVIASDKIPYAVSAHSQWQCTLTPAALNLLSSYK